MYVKKMAGYVLPVVEKGLLDVFVPVTVQSANWTHWVSEADVRRCQSCHDLHGQIYPVQSSPKIPPPLHENCRCRIEAMEAIVAGTATNNGTDGADWWIKHRMCLPHYYISRDELIALNWKSSKPPAKYAPGKMLFGGIFENKDGHLPDSAGRVWYEADINYTSGRRNKHRIHWSNDGLMFVTYNHGETYYEIT